MKSILASFLFTIVSLAACAQDFKIVITNYYFGRAQYTTTVTSDSLRVKENNFNGKIKNTARKLIAKERESLGTFLKDFPLSSLKDKYVNDRVEDGTQIGFSIKIGSVKKDIYIANVYQKDLGRLCDEVVKLLPYDYIMYNKRAVPYEE